MGTSVLFQKNLEVQGPVKKLKKNCCNNLVEFLSLAKIQKLRKSCLNSINIWGS